jgi:hypothetical protein
MSSYTGPGPKAAEDAIMIVHRAKSVVKVPAMKENLPSIQAMFSEHSRGNLNPHAAVTNALYWLR